MQDTPHKTAVVLASEEALIREGIAALCRETGRYEVVAQCVDGVSALRSIQRLSPGSVAVVDLQLPGLDTLELIAKLRQQRAPVRIVILSASRERKAILEALRSGADAYVLRSSHPSQLFEAFDQILQGGIYLSPQLEPEKLFGPADDPISRLSTREYQVFSLLVEGLRPKEIAGRLDLSPKTVDTYRGSLMRKLEIHDLAGLVKFAVQRQLTAG